MKRQWSGAIIPAINTTTNHSGARFAWWFLVAGLAGPGALSGASFNVPPPASLSVTSAPTGVRVTYRGATNFQYLVQASTNWLNWSLLASNIATNQAITFTDAQALALPARFYKATTLTTPFIYQGTFRNGESGSFLLFARTNNQATFIGINTTRNRVEHTSLFSIDGEGKGCGTFIAGAPGCLFLTPTNTLLGNFTNAVPQFGTFSGVQKGNLGVFNGYAGLYSGPVLAPSSGSAKIILSPDGTLAFYLSISSPEQITDGQIHFMPSTGIVNFFLLNGSHVTGTHSRPSRAFSLTIHDGTGTILIGTVSLSLSERLF